MIFQAIVILTLAIIINSFLFYPLLIILISAFKKKEELSSYEYTPTITILIAAHNEETVIEQRVKNIASLNYDFSKIKVLIGSDNSDDGTNEIIKKLENEYDWLRVFVFEKRQGKAGVLNKLLEYCSSDLLIFTDANTEFESDTIKKLVQKFQNPKVGGVAGRLILTDMDVEKNASVEERKYWLYETMIKKSEGELGILIGANGGIFAIRKDLYEPIPITKAVTDDLYISLSVLIRGYQFSYCNDSIAYEKVGSDVKKEYQRKVRFSATNFQTLIELKKMLWQRNIFLSYAFFSHKISRWLLPFMLMLLMIGTIMVMNNGLFFLLVFVFQLLFYLSALLGLILAKVNIKISIFSMPYFFMVTNAAILVGFFRFISGRHSLIWQSTPR